MSTNFEENSMKQNGLNGMDEELEERLHFEKVVNTFLNYKTHANAKINKNIRYIESLQRTHQQKLAKYKIHLNDIKKCVDINFQVMLKIVDNASKMFENIDYGQKFNTEGEGDDDEKKTKFKPATMDIDKTHSIMKQIVREWSSDGYLERISCFQPIIDAIDQKFQSINSKDIRVLVPGAGLGRLAFEIAKRGYTCQGNEYSLFMLFASNFILNRCKTPHEYEIHPWIHQHHNHFNCADQVRGIYFPDVDPSSIPKGTDFSMAAGNFVEIYTEKNKWDAVATCFFIDTAHNIVAYCETIWKILKPGGIWVNLGPLLYHFADMANEDSLEPTFDLLKEIILSFGFRFLVEKTGLRSYYTQNPESMLSYEYNSVFFVCEKLS